MPLYTYSAAKEHGEIVQGEREAESEKALAASLKLEGLLLLKSEEKNTPSGLAGLNASIDLSKILGRLKPIGLVDKMFFARNLGVMVAAGLPLTRALDALIRESANPKFKRVLEDLNRSIVKGKSFAESLRSYDKVFGPLFINMIEVGETTGKLTLVLKLLANQMKKDHTLRKRVKSALIYPAIIIATLLIVGGLMMVYVVPTLSQTIKELGAELPPTTLIIIAVSDFLVNNTLWALAGLALLAALFIRAVKTKRGKELFDRTVLRLPLFGPLIKKFNAARFCRTLSYLITSGVPIVRSLEITAGVLGNTRFNYAIKDAASEIQKGRQLAELLAGHPDLFQPLVIQMVQVGEETGKLSEMLLRLALFFEEDVTATTKNMSSIIEPVLMIIIGAAVGFFAISMLQPIYSSLGNL